MSIESRIERLEKAAINPAGGFDLTRLTDDELLGIEAFLSRTASANSPDTILSPELEAALKRVSVKPE
jgi:hypothetical protein